MFSYVTVEQRGDFLFDEAGQRELDFDLAVTPHTSLEEGRKELLNITMLVQGWRISLAR